MEIQATKRSYRLESDLPKVDSFNPGHLGIDPKKC